MLRFGSPRVFASMRTRCTALRFAAIEGDAVETASTVASRRGKRVRIPTHPAIPRAWTLRNGPAYPRGSHSRIKRRPRRAAFRASPLHPTPLQQEIRSMEATKTKLVEYRVKNGVAWLELTDPPANTY